MRFKLDRQFYIPKGAEVMAKQGDAIVYGYTDNKITAVAFKGRAQKPSWHHIFKTEEQRQAYIDRWFKQLEMHEETKALYRRNKQAEILEADIKTGDYFYTSWGYDQTNIDYLVVVAMSATGKTAKCRMAEAIHIGVSCQSDVLMPGVACGETFQMKVSGKESLTGSYPFCNNTSMRLGHFSKTTIGETKHQTMAQFGH